MRFKPTLLGLVIGAMMAAGAQASVISSGTQSYGQDYFLTYGDSFTSSESTTSAVLDVLFTPTVQGSVNTLLFGLYDHNANDFVVFEGFGGDQGFTKDGTRKTGFAYSFNDLTITSGHNYTFGVLGLGSNYSGDFSYTLTNPVPEPETYALMGLGLAALIARRRKASK
ncbi:MAG TPA: PEP-CTERM sorting domain-containing protein [Chitinolyticbacter sp.]|nr:PEP-CTERM sorting domain-containing protein [Chitinolyticbacter sp.]